MIRYLKFLIAILASASLWTTAAAASDGFSTDFYKASVPVLSQDAKERQYAAQKGLQEVLLRLSGSEEVLLNDSVQAAIGKALQYVEQFQYDLVSEEDLISRGYKDAMTMTFAPQVVESILRESGQRFWPVNRPKTLVWLVEDNIEHGKELINQDSLNPIIDNLSETAAKRGLPLAFPLLDLEDQMAVSADDVWSLQSEKIIAASDRYDAGVVLVGRFSYTSRGELWSTWQFFHRGDSKVYDSRTETVDNIGDLALVPLSNYLSDRYSIVPQQMSSPSLIMVLRGIESFKDYRSALDYLEGVAVIDHISLDAVKSNMLLLSLKTEADLDRFVNAIALDNKLESLQEYDESVPKWQRVNLGTRENPLQYAWGNR